MMELTKLEKAAVIGMFVTLIGEQDITKYIDMQTIEKLNETFGEMVDDTSPKVLRESSVNAINKMIQDLLEEGTTE